MEACVLVTWHYLTLLDMTFLKHSHAQKSCKEDLVKLYGLTLEVWSWT